MKLLQQRTPYQSVVLRCPLRMFFMLWRRQGRKSSTLADIALKEMLREPGRNVIYVSASLMLGREIILKESAVMHDALVRLSQKTQHKVIATDIATSKEIPINITPEKFADIYEQQRLEFRLYHSRTIYSRTTVIAPNAATARGWSGTVLLDEYGFISDLQDLLEAVMPIVSAQKDFRFIGATTPPKDSAHYSYELTAPPIGTEFKPNIKGNWYESQAGYPVHRVDIHDAALAGIQIYDPKTGESITPEQLLERSIDRDADRRNYFLHFLLGGTGAVTPMSLYHAQELGRSQCRYVQVEDDYDLDDSLRWLTASLGPGVVACGWDLATTEDESSNPSAFAVVEQTGNEYPARLICTWKACDDEVQVRRARRILNAIAARKVGGKARRLCIDSTNERLFAGSVRKKFGPLVMTELVVASERVERPGHEAMNYKQYLGSQLATILEDGLMPLPAERYIYDDFKLVIKSKGSFNNRTGPSGQHGDCWDACKLALYGVISKRGNAGARAVALGLQETIA